MTPSHLHTIVHVLGVVLENVRLHAEVRHRDALIEGLQELVERRHEEIERLQEENEGQRAQIAGLQDHIHHLEDG